MKNEKRYRKRVPFVIKAVLAGEKTEEVETLVQNISMNGLFLLCKKDIPLHSVKDIAIILEFGTEKLSVNLKGEIVRVQKPEKIGGQYGIAVTITEIDADSSITLFKMVQFQSKD